MTLFIVPLESYDLRYTEQWNRWFPRATQELALPTVYFDVPEETRTELGADVLNAVRTNQYRARQIDQILEFFERGAVKDGDTFLFHTLWFPGIEALAYVRDTTGISFRIAAVLHAGSYDPWDFRARSGMDPWSAPLEESWLALVDRVILASEFHRQMVLDSRRVDPAKLEVTGLPFSSEEVRLGRETLMASREPSVAFPHRPTPEKNPDVVDVLREQLEGAEVLVTRERSRSKSEYLDLLARATVCISDSLQETFGYSMLEASALGCIPLVPDRLCYREMYPERYRFGSRAELVEKTRRALAGEFGSTDDLEPLLSWADGSLQRLLSAALRP